MSGVAALASALLALGAYSDEPPYRVEVEVTGIGQEATNTLPGGEDSATTGSGLLRLSTTFGRGLSAVLAVEGWEGDGFRPGLDLDTLTPVNGDVAVRANAAITEAYFTTEPPETGFRLSLGKVDVTTLFCVSEVAGNPRNDFTNYAFRSSAAVAYPGGGQEPYSPAAWMTLRPRGRPVEFTLGWAAMDHDDLGSDPYLFGELRLRRGFLKLGLFGWQTGGTYPALGAGGPKDDPAGWGACVDWKFRGDFQLFAKAAFADGDVSEIASSWSAGLRVAGTPWNRPGDSFGVAYAQSIASDVAPDLDADEGVFEVYYKFTIMSPDRPTHRPGIEITPHYQSVSNAGGIDSDSKAEITGLRIRAMYVF